MTAAEMIQSYAEIRARLMGPVARRQPTLRALPAPTTPPPKPTPEPATVIKPYQHKNRDWIDVSNPLRPLLKHRTYNEILFFTAQKYSVSVAELKGERRDKNMVRARHECFYRISKELGYSLPKIGRLIGGRDHTTVLAGIRRHEMRMNDPEVY